MKKEILSKKTIVYNSKYNFIFIHGWGVTYKTMLYFSSMWEDKYSTYLLSLPGFYNNKLETSYKLEDYLNDIEEFIKEKQLDNVLLIGHSFGGKLAMFLKLRNPSYKVVSIAPSIVENPFNLMTFIKIRLYKFFKKLNCPLYKLFKGSKDYQKTDGLLRKTFNNIVHSYMDDEDIKKINSVLLIGFKKDKEVNVKSLNRLNKINKNIIYKTFNGDHFSYFDYRYEIYILINEFIKGD